VRYLLTSDRSLRPFAKALGWVVDDLPGGRIEGKTIVCGAGRVRLSRDASLKGTVGYAVKTSRDGFVVSAAEPGGFLAGILNLARALDRGERPDRRVKPRFVSRFYKHEANLGGPSNHRPIVSQLDEAFWVRYCKQLVRLHFTGLVLYTGYHPFEHFLDYEEFPEAASDSSWQRSAVLRGLKTAFGIARAFGLETYLQHYVTHFPEGLALEHDIGIRTRDGDGRLAAVEHPVLRKYWRYVYRRTFQLIPELTGYYLNFESAPLAVDFVLNTLHKVAAKKKPAPSLVIRLWDCTSIPEVRKLVRQWPGKVRLAHKIMDFADVYYYPKADRRIREWKKALPRSEFMFIVGPCHNCATSQSRTLWDDPAFVRETLDDARKKGADSVSFHTVYELLDSDIEIDRVADERESAMASLNRGHLDAFVDYVRAARPGQKTLVSRAAERLETDQKTAANVLKAIRHASQVPLLTYQQFFYTSDYEGYLVPARANHYADPFFFLAMTCADHEAKGAPNLFTAWLNTTSRRRLLPDDVQSVIDFVDPRKRRAGRSPIAIASALRKHAEAAVSLCSSVASAEFPARDVFVEEILRLYNWGMRVNYEIRAAAEVYRLFFVKSRQAAGKAIDRAVAHLRDIFPHIRRTDDHSARRLPLLEEADIEEDIKSLRALKLHIERRAFPFKAFAAYAESIRTYNEIRRTVRACKAVRSTETALIRRQLKAAIAAARRASTALRGKKVAGLKENIDRWRAYLKAELDGLKPPVYRVLPESRVPDDEGFVQLSHDQCFRYGENCIADLDAFFTSTDFQRREDIHVRAVRVADGLKVSLLERGVDVDERAERWNQFRGTQSDSFFARLFVDRNGRGRRTETFKVFSEGRLVFREAVEIRGKQDRRVELASRISDGRANLKRGGDWWRLDYVIPWKALGGRPGKGERWRVNFTANPAIARNRQSIWCPGYEFVAGKSSRMGTFLFV
jgi:hypothetical protein